MGKKKDNGWLWFFSIGTLAVLLLSLAIYGMAHKTNINAYGTPATQGDAQ